MPAPTTYSLSLAARLRAALPALRDALDALQDLVDDAADVPALVLADADRPVPLEALLAALADHPEAPRRLAPVAAGLARYAAGVAGLGTTVELDVDGPDEDVPLETLLVGLARLCNTDRGVVAHADALLAGA